MEAYRAREIMGKNFIGVEELKKIQKFIPLDIPSAIPEIKYDEDTLISINETHVLVLCVPSFSDGRIVNIRNLKEKIGLKEAPCFYNQDWYMNEQFIDVGLDSKWILVSKNLINESRGVSPNEIKKRYELHTAIELTYVFFTFYFISNGEKLWNNDYVWCSDEDDKGDQIYVGRYTDASGLNLDGFEIHRHLKIKKNYGII